MRTKKDALWLTNILRESETKRRAEQRFLDSHPLWQTLMQLTPEQRDIMRKLLEVEQRAR